MSKVLVGTEERLRRLGKTYSGPPQNTALLLQGYRDGVNAAIAAMPEVDESDILDYADYVRQIRLDRDKGLSYWEEGAPIPLPDFAALARIKEAQ